MVPEFMVRVKLPRSDACICPDEDPDYQGALADALSAARPDGYEYRYTTDSNKWPVDSEGFTWARLRCNDEKVAIAYWMHSVRQLKMRIAQIEEHAEAIARLI